MLYLRQARARLSLKAFRGEPAISRFDWPFTPCHGSSLPFLTDYRSALQRASPRLQPAHGKITLASGPLRATCAPKGSPSLRLRDSHPFASPRAATRRLILQKTRRKGPRPRDILSVHGFRFCFTPLAGVLFAFPSRYSSAIGSAGVFSLGSWSTRIQAGFLVPRPTQAPRAGSRQGFAYGALTLRGRPSHAVPLPCRFLTARVAPRAALQPRTTAVWAPPSSLAATGGISLDFLSAATQMVHFAACGPPPLCVQGGVRAITGARVTPFGGPRLQSDMCSSARLFAACRGLHRPLAPSRHPPWTCTCLTILRAPRPRLPAGTPAGHADAPTSPGRGACRRASARRHSPSLLPFKHLLWRIRVLNP